MINGAGGYGFVLAPYLADLMTKHLLDAQPLPEFLKPQRFYARWAKKEARNL
jgi:tRNA 5-methylaminomethyl-2-thiouridine biosynthesis bifunctional protein